MEGFAQYGVRGPWAHEILFGVVDVWLQSKWTKATFFQLENTPHDGSPKNAAFHGKDFINYKRTGMNIGPHGHSLHTDQNFLFITSKELQEKNIHIEDVTQYFKKNKKPRAFLALESLLS